MHGVRAVDVKKSESDAPQKTQNFVLATKGTDMIYFSHTRTLFTQIAQDSVVNNESA